MQLFTIWARLYSPLILQIHLKEFLFLSLQDWKESKLSLHWKSKVLVNFIALVTSALMEWRRWWSLGGSSLGTSLRDSWQWWANSIENERSLFSKLSKEIVPLSPLTSISLVVTLGSWSEGGFFGIFKDF